MNFKEDFLTKVWEFNSEEDFLLACRVYKRLDITLRCSFESNFTEDDVQHLLATNLRTHKAEVIVLESRRQQEAESGKEIKKGPWNSIISLFNRGIDSLSVLSAAAVSLLLVVILSKELNTYIKDFKF